MELRESPRKGLSDSLPVFFYREIFLRVILNDPGFLNWGYKKPSIRILER